MQPIEIALLALGAAFVAAVVLGFRVRHRRAHAYAHAAKVGVKALADTVGSLSTSLRLSAEPGGFRDADHKLGRLLTLR